MQREWNDKGEPENILAAVEDAADWLRFWIDYSQRNDVLLHRNNSAMWVEACERMKRCVLALNRYASEDLP